MQQISLYRIIWYIIVDGIASPATDSVFFAVGGSFFFSRVPSSGSPLQSMEGSQAFVYPTAYRWTVVLWWYSVIIAAMICMLRPVSCCAYGLRIVVSSECSACKRCSIAVIPVYVAGNDKTMVTRPLFYVTFSYYCTILAPFPGSSFGAISSSRLWNDATFDPYISIFQNICNFPPK